MSRVQPSPATVPPQVSRGGGVVSSPGRQSLQSQYPASQYNPAPVYSQASGRSYAPSTTYNPGYQEQPPRTTGGYQEQPSVNRRYLSEGELLGEGGVGSVTSSVGPSTSAGQLQVQISISLHNRNILCFLPGVGGITSEVSLHVETATRGQLPPLPTDLGPSLACPLSFLRSASGIFPAAVSSHSHSPVWRSEDHAQWLSWRSSGSTWPGQP